MSWYYSVNNESRGPVPATDLVALIENGSVTSEALVWREGLPEWVPVARVSSELGIDPPIPHATQRAATTATPVSAGPAGPAGAAVAAVADSHAQKCVECGSLFPRSELLSMEGTQVCARCKPIFLQKMREGVPHGGAFGVWRRGREMVVALEAELPERCVKCNTPAPGKRLKRPLFWHHPALYIMILFPGLIFYALVAICVRKKATLYVALCDAHRSQRRWAILTSWTAILLGIAAFCSVGAFQGDAAAIPILTGIVLVIGGAIYGVIRSRIVTAKKIDQTHAYVGGVGPEFLAAFPEWPNP